MKSTPRYHTFRLVYDELLVLSTECYFHFLFFCFPTKCAVRARRNSRQEFHIRRRLILEQVKITNTQQKLDSFSCFLILIRFLYSYHFDWNNFEFARGILCLLGNSEQRIKFKNYVQHQVIHKSSSVTAAQIYITHPYRPAEMCLRVPLCSCTSPASSIGKPPLLRLLEFWARSLRPKDCVSINIIRRFRKRAIAPAERWRSGSALSPSLFHPFRGGDLFSTDGAFRHLSNFSTLREIHARFVIQLDTRYVSWHALVPLSLFIDFSAATVTRSLVDSGKHHQHPRGVDLDAANPSHPLTWIFFFLLLLLLLIFLLKVRLFDFNALCAQLQNTSHLSCCACFLWLV